MLTLGALIGAALLAPPSDARPGDGLVWLLFIGSSAHVASTAWFYTVPQVRRHARRHPARYIWVPLALIAGGGLLALAVPPMVLRWCQLPYFGWQFFHYQKQNLGIAALAAASRQVPGPRPAERRALMGTGLAGIAGLLARPWLLQLAVRPVLRPLYPVAATAFGLAMLAGLAALARRPAAQRPPGYQVIYLLGLGFPLPVFLFGSPYAAVAGMTIAHGLQYLLLVGLVAGGGRSPGRAAALIVMISVALAGGALLAAASHLHAAASPARFGFGAYLGAVMAHFVVDGGLWRLRDEFPRSFLGARVPFLVRVSAHSGRSQPGTSSADQSAGDVHSVT
ncbi:MAG: hypothetical protein ACLP7J_08695 [Streptosporangiaceae bacterium]